MALSPRLAATLTCAFKTMDAVTMLVHTHVMALPVRDTQIVSFLDAFKQATHGQLAEALLPCAKSRTSTDRALKRLLANNYVRRLENRRLTNAQQGGVSPLVYRLGPAGWRMCEREGRWRSDQAVDEHALEIVDAYVASLRTERGGLLSVRRYLTEPRCWFTSADYEDGDIYLEPDLLLEVERGGNVSTWWLEVDRGHQNPDRHVEKLERYAAAYRRGLTDDEAARFYGGQFPRVVFVMTRQDKAELLQRVIVGGDYPVGLFTVVHREQFPAALL